jgi:protein-S-isoprenylcysteine O-methyltransferase Ste14
MPCVSGSACMAEASGGLIRTIARRRVALGFVAAAIMLVLARPTWESWGAGLLVAAIGECLRIWAAGHLEKGREVTRSGPYRFFGHPLYAGSMVISLGVAVAARGALPALLAGLYMGITIASAVQVEEAHLRNTFGADYDDYRSSRVEPMRRRFSPSRVMRNREYRAVTGLLLGFGLLALKIVGI